MNSSVEERAIAYAMGELKRIQGLTLARIEELGGEGSLATDESGWASRLMGEALASAFVIGYAAAQADMSRGRR